MSGHANSLKVILLALGANFAIFVAKLAAALITRSGAMLAEAVHSLADCGNQGLLLLGLRQAKRPPSDDYPLGWGRALYFWSFLVAILLFSVGGVFSIYEGVHKLTHPEPLSWPWLAVGVLVFGLVAEGLSMRGCLQEVRKEQGDRSLWQWFRESRSSELLVIFGEDSAALLGLLLALLAVLATMLTGNLLFDALGTIAIGVLLVVVAVLVAVEVKGLLIGHGVEPKQRETMLAFLRERPEVECVYNLLTLHMGPEVMVAIKARMRPASSGRAQVDDINAVERDFRARFAAVRWCFFEPDVDD
ncbi:MULTISPECIES: cation diffusion facilitator family transporter [Oleiagrimonas]|jgi:cation diffusion facilitator family transporter|uniref:Cation diffusion facilitator family transporter n=1 Tax=Oleiagrimonas citrea TaxID=1665687 RepID=A0A846ZKD1_9GAMM|nr:MULTISPECIES: cation diffusion facilitator family transporter [Oleiagrimonas]NKZ37851.1 cation diffusion facilitator family transporter [Oleiagrimonas citrea]RAP57356.1 cation efflux family transporter [Oleiagrimonas sp. MCCC 1A03011]